MTVPRRTLAIAGGAAALGGLAAWQLWPASAQAPAAGRQHAGAAHRALRPPPRRPSRMPIRA